MKLRTKLYININNDLTTAPQYEELDMFDFESIELTSSIQEIRDIGSVFTDFSQEFSVPASVNNNRIFTHYYNTNLLNQFDARIKRKGLITINNLTFREGYIRLSEVKLKNNRASSYKLTFFGELVNLKQVLGDDELKDLATALIKYDHEYSIDNVYDGFIDGLGLVSGQMVKSSNRDIVYPSISVSDRWYYKSDPTDLGEKDYKQGKTVNLFTNNDVSLNYGISYLQLKPAIKVKNVIDAIQEVYSDRGIVFSNDFFSDVEFNQLYLLLHSFKGDILSSGGDKFKEYLIGTSDFNSDFEYDGGDGEVRPVEVSYFENNRGIIVKELYILELNITTTNPLTGGEYTVELLEGDEILYSEDLISSQLSSFTIEPEQVTGFAKTYNNLTYKIKTKSLVEFDLYLKMSKIRRVENRITGSINETAETSFYDLKDGGQSFVSGGVNVAKFMPKIKIYDFLKGLFNMFNLTAYVDNGLIVVKTLDKFYTDGKEIDISNQVDTKDITVKRMNLFSNINFDFSEPKTFGMIKQNEIQQDDYGNLEYEPTLNNLIFDGDRYSIKLPFEKLFFDRLSDDNTDTLTDFGNGWLVDKDENETITAPVLFFNRNTTISSSQYFGFINKTAQLTTYNRPSNSSNNELSTINFNAENDEFTGNLIQNSLFKLHYENYIENVFNINSRMYSISAVLNLDTLNRYNMNDRFIINNNKFVINSIRTDLSNGKTELELITDFDLPQSSSAPDSTAPSVPTGLTLLTASSTSARVIWDDSTDNVGVAGYNIYINNVLYDYSVIAYAELSLAGGTSYNFQVTAFDAENNESDKSSILIITTT